MGILLKKPKELPKSMLKAGESDGHNRKFHLFGWFALFFV